MFKVKGYILALSTMGFFSMAFATQIPSHQLIIAKDVKHDTSLPLRDLQTPSKIGISAQKLSGLNPIKTPAPALIPLKGFQGLGVGLGDYPVTAAQPEISASVGVTQYFQWVNHDIAVFDKATGQVAAGFPKPGNAIWAGFGGICETNNTGDPIVKYDQLAGRWIVSQNAFANIISGPFYQCVAVSTSEDATGSYHRYAFQHSSRSEFGQLGLWPDGYYMAFNMLGRAAFGPQVCALERDKMLAGLPATSQCVQLLPSQSGSLLPADLDGRVLPPAGNPGYFIGLTAEPNNLLLFKYYVDFANPANTHLDVVTLPVASYTRACNNTNGNNCVIQPNTFTQLDLLNDRMTGRLAYRQFPDYGSMVVNHNVEGPAPKFAPAIRWYEFRVLKDTPTFNPILYQQSTLAPDSKNRFLGAIAIDRFNNVALGYSVTSSLIYPSLELAMHNYTDQLNTMTIQPLFTGRGSQINGISAWGGHSSMSVDPVDECTFWYTNQYLKTTGSLNWSTFILKFKLAACV